MEAESKARTKNLFIGCSVGADLWRENYRWAGRGDQRVLRAAMLRGLAVLVSWSSSWSQNVVSRASLRVKSEEKVGPGSGRPYFCCELGFHSKSWF